MAYPVFYWKGLKTEYAAVNLDKMDEEKAIKTLTTEIVNHFGSLIVHDEKYKNKLVKDAEYFYQFSDPIMIGFDRFYVTDGYRWGFVNSERIKASEFPFYESFKKAIDKEENCQGANYFFVDKTLQANIDDSNGRGINFFVTPYSIIGKKEINNIRELFYKDVHPNVLSAMDVLGVENYVGLYELYSDGGVDEEFLDNYSIYLKLKDSLSHVFRDNSMISKVEFTKYFDIKLGDLNKKLKKMSIGKEVAAWGNESVRRYDIENVINEFELNTAIGRFKDLLPGFLNSVFTIPYENQDIEVNKEILKSFENLDYIGILFREYSQGEHFREYFSCLDAGRQRKVVGSLKSVARNPVCDSFLWGKGFRGVELDYLDLYRKDASGFIEYFGGKSPEERKVILKDIMDCDFINEAVADWLNKNEPELVKEVGLNE